MAYTLIEHQEEDGKENEKNMKDVMISDFFSILLNVYNY